MEQSQEGAAEAEEPDLWVLVELDPWVMVELDPWVVVELHLKGQEAIDVCLNSLKLTQQK